MTFIWQLENFCHDARLPSTTYATPFNYLIVPKPEQMLRASVGLAFRRARLQYIYSILRGKDLDTGLFSEERREQQFEKLKIAQAHTLDIQNWHEFIKALKQAGYNNESFISSNNNILYSYVFFLIGRIDYKVDLYELKKLIAKWFFMCSITGRYTGSPETAMEIDLAKFRSVDNADDFVKELLESGFRANKSALERHHLFPKAWLMRNGITEQRDINQIANFALVEWSDNIAISDKEPKVYLPIYEQRFSEEELRKMRFWHALPENWQEKKYKDFLLERRRLIAEVVKSAYQKL